MVADSGETIVVGVGAITGGGFEAIAANPASSSVTTTISDEASADVTTVSLSASATASPKAAASPTPPSLTSPAATPVTVTLEQRRDDHDRGRCHQRHA